MNDSSKDQSKSKRRQREDKDSRLSKALRENLKKRKSLQRGRGGPAPDPIKNKNRLTD